MGGSGVSWIGALRTNNSPNHTTPHHTGPGGGRGGPVLSKTRGVSDIGNSKMALGER